MADWKWNWELGQGIDLDFWRRRCNPTGIVSLCKQFEAYSSESFQLDFFFPRVFCLWNERVVVGSDEGGAAALAAVDFAGHAHGPDRRRLRRSLPLGRFPSREIKVRVCRVCHFCPVFLLVKALFLVCIWKWVYFDTLQFLDYVINWQCESVCMYNMYAC